MSRKKSKVEKAAAGTLQKRPTRQIVKGDLLVELPEPLDQVADNETAYNIYRVAGLELISRKLLTPGDLFTLNSYAIEAALYFTLRSKTAKRMTTAGSTGQRRIDPRVALANDARNAMLALSKRLGLDPYSRGLISVPADQAEADTKPDDEFDF